MFLYVCDLFCGVCGCLCAGCLLWVCLLLFGCFELVMCCCFMVVRHYFVGNWGDVPFNFSWYFIVSLSILWCWAFCWCFAPAARVLSVVCALYSCEVLFVNVVIFVNLFWVYGW